MFHLHPPSGENLCKHLAMTEPRYSRRQLLAGGVAGATTLGLAKVGHVRSTGRDTVHRALQTKAAGSDIGAVEHVVFLMQENRSFDHYYGTMGGVNGYEHGAENQRCLHPGLAGWDRPTLLPFHMNTKKQQAECTYDLDHSWGAEHASWNGGAMDSFVSTHTSAAYEGALGTNTMGYYTKPDLPFYYDLAKKFTVCDNYFCSVLGPTHPNRLMQMTGTIDPAGVAGGPILVTNRTQTTLQVTCSWTTMPEVLQDAGITWKAYNPYGPVYQPGFSHIRQQEHALVLRPVRVGPDVDLYQNAFSYYGPNVDGGLTESGSPNDFAADVANGDPPPGLVDHPAGQLTTSTPGPARPRRVVHPADPRHAAVQPRGVGQDGPVHHVRRERRLLRPCPPASASGGDRR